MTDSSMTTTPVFLRPEISLELLVNRWYVWSHLVAPAQHAMNLAFRYVPLLESFIANPSVHAAAARNPDLIGGPFVPLKSEYVPAIRALLGEIRERCAALLAFATDLKKMDQELQDSANGYSLDELYTRLPVTLAGLVELSYDINNHPRIRVLEELLYSGGLDNTHVQEISLVRTDERERGFFLNTPRLESPERVFLPLAFADARLDLLAAARLQPVELPVLAQSLVGARELPPIFNSFFSPAPPTRHKPAYNGTGVRIRYFGHACVLVQSAEVSILVDPLVAWETNATDGRLTFVDLPDFIDYVVITHNHQDHFSLDLLVQLRRRIGCILVPGNNPGSLPDPSMKQVLRSLGFSEVRVLEPLEPVAIEAGELIGLPFFGEHAGLDIHSKLCVAIKLAGRSIVLVADSACPDPAYYRHLKKRLGRIDVLFIGMECHGAPLTWLYGPYLTRPVRRRDDDSRRLSGSNFAQARTIVESFQCPRVFVYAMAMEPWMRHLSGLEYTPDSIQITESNKLLEYCKDAGIEAERLQGCKEMLL